MKNKSMATFDVNSLFINDVHVNAKGIKSAQLLDENRKPLFYHGDLARSPFGPSNFDKDESAPRMNIELRMSPEHMQFFEQLDEFIVQYLSVHSERLFKKQLSPEAIRDRYSSSMKQSDKHDPLLTCKINIPKSMTPCRFWTEAGERTQMPADWRRTDLKPKLHLSHLWIMGNSCGLVINLTDALVTEESAAFPWTS